MMSDTAVATIQINGKDESLASSTIAALLEEKEIGANARGIAVAVNGAVVLRAAWRRTTLSAGDSVEIVRVLQGG
jgi:sulfur carrier protein